MPHSHLTPPILPPRPDTRHRYLSVKASRDSGEITVQGFVAATLSLLALLWVLAPLAGASETVGVNTYTARARRTLLSNSGVRMNLSSAHVSSDVRRAQGALVRYISESLGGLDESQLAVSPRSRVCHDSVRIGVSRRSDPAGALGNLSRAMSDLFQSAQTYLRTDNSHAPPSSTRRLLAAKFAAASALASQGLAYCGVPFATDHELGASAHPSGGPAPSSAFAAGLLNLGSVLSTLQSQLDRADPALVSIRD